MKEENNQNIKVRRNPYPGFRSFTFRESSLFFGRDQEINSCLKTLSRDHITLLNGPSGSGKTSLIQAGIIPALHAGLWHKPANEVAIIHTKPGIDPVLNLANDVLTALRPGDKVHAHEISLAKAFINRSDYGLAELISRQGQKSDYILIIDDFDQLLRYAGEKTMDEHAQSYINQLLKVIESDLSIYVMVAVNQENAYFLNQFEGLISGINNHVVFLSPLDREHLRHIIEMPLSVMSCTMDPTLVKEMLNTYARFPGQLSLLQHALNRSFYFSLKRNAASKQIARVDYLATGGIPDNIAKHIEALYSKMDESNRLLAKRLFNSFVHYTPSGKETSYPVKAAFIADILEISLEKLASLIDVFNDEETQFIWKSDATIKATTLLKLQHDNLIKHWPRLKHWTEREKYSVDFYREISKKSAAFQIGKGQLLHGLDLQQALDWKQKENPNASWARRINPTFERTMVFLEESKKKADESAAIKEKELEAVEKKQKRKSVIILLAGIFAVLLFVFSTVRLGISLANEIAAKNALKESKSELAISIKERDEALEKAQIAQQALVEAELQKIVAEKQTVISSEERELAQLNAMEALKVQEDVVKNLKETEEQKDQAIASARQAEVETQKATRQTQEAYKRRMLSISENMAVKSTQISNPELKGLLAYQAYQFNKAYGGENFNADIYQGMLDALKELDTDLYSRLSGHRGAVNAVAFSNSSNTFYSAGTDGKVYKWDMQANGNNRKEIVSNDFINRSLAVSADGRWLAVGTAGSIIQLFDLKSGRSAPSILQGHNGVVGSLAFTPDNNFLVSSGTNDRTIRMWNLGSLSGQVIANTPSAVRSLAVSANGQYIAAGTNDGSVTFYNKNEGYAESQFFQDPGNAVYAVAFSNTGNLIAAGDKEGRLRVWNYLTGKAVRTGKIHSARIVDIKFSPDDQLLATSSYDGNIAMWNPLQPGSSPILLREHSGWVLSVAFSPNGKLLVSSSDKGNMILTWPTRTDFMADEFCATLSRNLTQNEWNQYVAPDIQYSKTCTNLADTQNED